MPRISHPPGRTAACRSLAAACVATLAACGDPCTNTERARARAPDGRHDAVAFGRVCKRRGPASAQLSVVAPGAPVVGYGNVFVSERDVPIEVRWTGPAALHVRYPRVGETGMRPEIDGVRITYDSTAAAPALPADPASP